jgi:hypothetical protein
MADAVSLGPQASPGNIGSIAYKVYCTCAAVLGNSPCLSTFTINDPPVLLPVFWDKLGTSADE